MYKRTYWIATYWIYVCMLYVLFILTFLTNAIWSWNEQIEKIIKTIEQLKNERYFILSNQMYYKNFFFSFVSFILRLMNIREVCQSRINLSIYKSSTFLIYFSPVSFIRFFLFTYFSFLLVRRKSIVFRFTYKLIFFLFSCFYFLLSINHGCF